MIVLHMGSEAGFVDGALRSFECKRTGDYHEEMDGKFFEKWFGEVLPLLEDGSVIVMDNAPYHSLKIEKTFYHRLGKSENYSLAEREEHSIRRRDAESFEELWQIAALHKTSYDLYVIDEMARSQHKTVLRLPPYHCELYPIELIWATIKNYVAKRNTTFKFLNVTAIFNDAISTITPDD